MKSEPLLLLYPHELLLSRPVIDPTGHVIGGWVVNGCWYFRSNGVVDLAYREDDEFLNPVTKFPARQQEVVLVPNVYRSYEYSEAMQSAKGQERINLKDPTQLAEYETFLDQIETEAINLRRAPSGYSDMDDDIAF